MRKSNKFSPEVRERAVRMVLEHRSTRLTTVTEAHPRTLRLKGIQYSVDAAKRNL